MSEEPEQLELPFDENVLHVAFERKPDYRVARYLAQLAEDCVKGEILGVALIAYTAEGWHTFMSEDIQDNPFEALGAMEVIKAKMIQVNMSNGY